MWTPTFTACRRRVIALDAQDRPWCARPPEGKAPHLIAAVDQAAGAVLGQIGVDAKSNEISAARTLFAAYDLDGAVVTLDAMHTHSAGQFAPGKSVGIDEPSCAAESDTDLPHGDPDSRPL